MTVPAPAARTSHFAYLTSYSASNIAPVSGVDEQVADGRYVLDVIVTSGDASTAEALAPKLAGKLDARFRLARKGRLHARPVKLPKLKAGPPPGGPDLSALALRKSDLVGKVTLLKQYVVDPAAISDFSVFMLPAGRFDALDQEIEWFPVANEANFYAELIRHHPAPGWSFHEFVAGPLSARFGRPRPLDEGLNPRSLFARSGVNNFGEVTLEPAHLTVRRPPGWEDPDSVEETP